MELQELKMEEMQAINGGESTSFGILEGLHLGAGFLFESHDDGESSAFGLELGLGLGSLLSFSSEDN
ncbi:MAG TPA: hypothetical protein VIR29_06695 [Anseongella sp.]